SLVQSFAAGLETASRGCRSVAGIGSAPRPRAAHSSRMKQKHFAGEPQRRRQGQENANGFIHDVTKRSRVLRTLRPRSLTKAQAAEAHPRPLTDLISIGLPRGGSLLRRPGSQNSVDRSRPTQFGSASPSPALTRLPPSSLRE